MPSLGKASAELLLEAGIGTPDELRRVGAIEAYRRLRFVGGRRVTVTWIYALEIAIRGAKWGDLPARRAAQLARAARQIQQEVSAGGGDS